VNFVVDNVTRASQIVKNDDINKFHSVVTIILSVFCQLSFLHPKLYLL